MESLRNLTGYVEVHEYYVNAHLPVIALFHRVFCIIVSRYFSQSEKAAYSIIKHFAVIVCKLVGE